MLYHEITCIQQLNLVAYFKRKWANFLLYILSPSLRFYMETISTGIYGCSRNNARSIERQTQCMAGVEFKKISIDEILLGIWGG